MDKKTRVGAIGTAMAIALALAVPFAAAPAYAKSKEHTGAAIRSWPSPAKAKGNAPVATRPASPVAAQSAKR